MQSVPILNLNLTQLNPLLRLINSRQIQRKEIVPSALPFVITLAENMSPAILTEIPMRGLQVGSVIIQLVARCGLEKLEVRVWVFDREAGGAEFLAEGAVAFCGGEIAGVEVYFVLDVTVGKSLG